MTVPERYDDPLFAICDRYSIDQFSCCLTPVRLGGRWGEAAFEALLTLKLNNFKTVQAMTAKLIDFS